MKAVIAAIGRTDMDQTEETETQPSTSRKVTVSTAMLSTMER